MIRRCSALPQSLPSASNPGQLKPFSAAVCSPPVDGSITREKAKHWLAAAMTAFHLGSKSLTDESPLAPVSNQSGFLAALPSDSAT